MTQAHKSTESETKEKGGDEMTISDAVVTQHTVEASNSKAQSKQSVESKTRKHATTTTASKASKPKTSEVVAKKTSKEDTRSQFEKIRDGVCPHCAAKLDKAISGSGVGKTRACLDKKCAHRFYFNAEIKTSKCLTCAEERRKASKLTPAPKPTKTKKDKK